ncbi:MAG: hypothetical protein ACBR12_24130 [Microcoleus sp.]
MAQMTRGLIQDSLFALLLSCIPTLLHYCITALLLSIACHCYRSPVTIIDRPSLLSIACHCYRSPVTVIDRLSLLSIACHCYRSPVTVIDRPSLLSIVVQRQSSPQLINNDNRAWVRESTAGGLSRPYPYLIIIIIP